MGKTGAGTGLLRQAGPGESSGHGRLETQRPGTGVMVLDAIVAGCETGTEVMMTPQDGTTCLSCS